MRSMRSMPVVGTTIENSIHLELNVESCRHVTSCFELFGLAGADRGMCRGGGEGFGFGFGID